MPLEGRGNVRFWIYIAGKKKAQGRETPSNSQIKNKLEQLNTHGNLELEQMLSSQLSGPPEAKERCGKAARNLVVMDNKKEEAWWEGH